MPQVHVLFMQVCDSLIKMKHLFFILLTVHTLWGAERIITLSPAINEIVFALGSGGQIVANTDYCLYPQSSQKIPKVGGYFSPSLEKIVASNPDLVIMQDNNQQLNQKLQQLGIKTKVISIDKLTHIKASIIEIGKILNKKQKALTIVANIDHELEKIKNIVHNKKILIVFGRNTHLDKQIFVAGQNLYYDEIINLSGNTNALQSTRKGQPVLNMENIIACNPDIVLLIAQCQQKVCNEDLISPWKKLPITATKNNAFYIHDKDYAGMPSDRLVLFLRDFRESLEAYKKNLNP